MTALRAAAITGCGLALPDQIVTNADLESSLDTSDEWIVERTGIRERRRADASDSVASLGADAGAAAMKDAGLTPDDIDLLLLATMTPDQQMPATATAIQDRLGLACGAIDLNAACAGYVYALTTAAAFVESGRARRALVIGAEIMHRLVDPGDRSTMVLFGDGAGATVVEAVAPPAGLLGCDLGCDGSLAAILEVPRGAQWMTMDGQEVFRRAVRVVTDSAQAALDSAGLTAEDVDLFIPHQANARIISAAASRLGIADERCVVNVDRYGNTSAASIPIAIVEAKEDGRVAGGGVVLLSGFGAGMAWASAVLRWAPAAEVSR